MYPNQQNPYGNNTGYPQAPNTGAPQPPQPLQPPTVPGNPYGAVPPLNNTSGASGHNPYEFIMNPNAGKHSMGFGKFTPGKQVGFLVAGLLVVIVALFAVFSALKPKPTTPELVAIVQRQQEILRISDEASDVVAGQSVSNFVTNTNLTVTTSQSQVVAYLAEGNRKLSSKELMADKSADTDTLLTNAQSAGNYDSVVTQTLVDELQTYESLLQTTYKKTASQSTKQLVQKNFTAVEALLEQAERVETSS